MGPRPPLRLATSSPLVRLNSGRGRLCCRLLALFGHGAMSDLSPLCAPKRKLLEASTVSAHTNVMAGTGGVYWRFLKTPRPTFSGLAGQGGEPFPPHER